MTDNTISDSFPRPVQEEGQQETPATLEMLADLLQKNPHLLPLLQPQGRGNAISKRLQPITSALAAVACGSYSWIRFLLVFLLTALFNVVNLNPEIPRESRAQLDKIERDLEEVKRKHDKVLHDTTKMQEKIQTAAESYYRISRNDDLEMEMGLVNSTCVLGTCQDALKYLEAEISDLQRGAKLTPTHILKQVVISTGLLIAAALTVGSHLGICLMIVAGILFVCKMNAQIYFNKQLLLAKCEDFRKNELRKAEQLHKELGRDVEYKLPSLKKQLAVLDIEVSLYTSLHSHSD